MSISDIKEIQRRKYKRYMVQDNVFAVFRLGPNSSRLVNIVDISRGGFAFKFVGKDEMSQDRFELDIFVSGDGRCLGKIPFEITSETTKAKEDRFYSFMQRRFGARFDDLSYSKALQIDSFINNHKVMDSLPDTPA
ncbi:MAG: PilZ domain-containing protein [Deltaproteobacteria bacterium]|nr:PilZ domain-containing protein [Deltaproteobacteria bacterium]MBW2220675.1 PilZ domain-containing protein [Deltaproteobacteria bacterium]